ncbi:hypothetical protein CMS1075 [Clavibacter sepedonicus]|uniref:Uncharacterized protein n=1 Tax=Clavibacter sepedonicus TaxID=31964 RepID=B0RGD3_CLASE|nr:hypothetical protein CMS1075 [Clavibacter sepedonicus]
MIADWFGGSPKLDDRVSQFGDINRRAMRTSTDNGRGR